MVMAMPAATRSRLAAAGGAELPTVVERAVDSVARHWGEPLVGAYVVGSIATDDVRGGASDLDLMVVVDSPADVRMRTAAGDEIVDIAAAAPLRGVEVVVYTAAALAQPVHPLRYELNVNAGPAMDRVIETAPRGDAFWFVLDVAAARQRSLVVAGRPADDVIGAVRDDVVLQALEESVRWHATHGAASPDAVLNACRTWHWLATGRWLSKTQAGRWAQSQPGAAAVIGEALRARAAGSDTALDTTAVADLVASVATRVRARASSG